MSFGQNNHSLQNEAKFRHLEMEVEEACEFEMKLSGTTIFFILCNGNVGIIGRTGIDERGLVCKLEDEKGGGFQMFPR